MSQYRINSETLTSIANAVRQKSETESELTPSEMVQTILNISTTDEDDVLRDLRGSLAENVGGDYDFQNMNIVQILGTFYPEINGEVIENNLSYRDGLIFTIRQSFSRLAIALDDEHFITADDDYDISSSLNIISSSLSTIKNKIIEVINSILDENYQTNTSWSDIVDIVEGLPTDVGNLITSSVTEAESESRQAVDEAINNIVQQNSLDVELVTGTWASTLSNLSAVFSAISELGTIPSGSISITENGTYDVTEKAEAQVNVPTRTQTDIDNAAIVAAWNNIWSSNVNSTGSNHAFSRFTGELPGIDISGATNARQMFYGLPMNKMTVNIGDELTDAYRMFYYCRSITEITLIGSTAQVTNFADAFNSCANLTTINGEIDFSSATNVSTMFSNSNRIVYVSFKPNTLHVSANLGLVGLSAQRALTLLNALVKVTNMTETLTLTLLGTMKESFNGTWCRLNRSTGLYESCLSTDDGAMTIMTAATSANEKGWVVV